jgi:hypothetical protein
LCGQREKAHGEKSIHRGYQNRISKAAKELQGTRGSASLALFGSFRASVRQIAML